MSTPADTSTTFVLPDAPETSRTSCRRTPRARASARRAASVAAPLTARDWTATTRAFACSPPTRVRDAPGLTRIVTRVGDTSSSLPHGRAGRTLGAAKGVDGDE